MDKSFYLCFWHPSKEIKVADEKTFNPRTEVCNAANTCNAKKTIAEAIVELKEHIGDFEIDTIVGKNHKGAAVTINDRATGYLWIRKLLGKEAAPLADKTIEALLPYKKRLKTIMADNGKEFAKHELIACVLEINFYFCKPYHSWERGANENTNGLIRQHIPKSTDFSEITDQYVAWIQDPINNRPRKKLRHLTPKGEF